MGVRTAEPKVSIGLPIYNGDRYLEPALRSLLAQTFEAFEVIVIDNASTDRSLEIARDLASEDARIRVHAEEENRGAPANFNKTFALATAKYFKWSAHDDLVEPRYLEECVGFLEAEADYALCHARARIVDSEGAPLRDYDLTLPNVESPVAAERFADMVLIRHSCFDAFSVIRRDVLARTPRIGPYLSSDRCLLAELVLHGKHRVLAEPLYLNRDHGGRSVKIETHERARKWFRQGERFVFPAWRLLGEYRRAIQRAPLTPKERRACQKVLGPWLAQNWGLLRGDLRQAAQQLLSLPGRSSAQPGSTS